MDGRPDGRMVREVSEESGKEVGRLQAVITTRSELQEPGLPTHSPSRDSECVATAGVNVCKECGVADQGEAAQHFAWRHLQPWAQPAGCERGLSG